VEACPHGTVVLPSQRKGTERAGGGMSTLGVPIQGSAALQDTGFHCWCGTGDVGVGAVVGLVLGLGLIFLLCSAHRAGSSICHGVPKVRKGQTVQSKGQKWGGGLVVVSLLLCLASRDRNGREGMRWGAKLHIRETIST